MKTELFWEDLGRILGLGGMPGYSIIYSREIKFHSTHSLQDMVYVLAQQLKICRRIPSKP